MEKVIVVLALLALVTFITYQQAEAITISAIPASPAFGPNDWISINLKIQGYNGGPILWLAHRPDGSTISGNITQVRGDGTVTQQIIRTAFDNYFGNWSINYRYENVNQTAQFRVNPIVLNVFTDKDLYYEPDMMHINITTSYYIPIAENAEYIHLNFYDQEGNRLKDIPEIDIRGAQHSIVYNFHMTAIADYYPAGLYKLRIQYYNTIVDVPFLLGKYLELMQIAAQTDKNTYQLGDIVNLDLLFTHVPQSEGTLKITDPLGGIIKRQFQVYSVHSQLSLSGITTKAGTYNYEVQYAGASTTGSFTVNGNSELLPNIEFGVFLDKLNYRPGDIIYAKAYTSQVLVNSVDLWVVNPDGVEYPKFSLPMTTSEEILPHKIGTNSTTGRWELYMDYDGIVRSQPFNVVGAPVSESEMLDISQFNMPTFVSYFGTATSFKDPTGIAIATDNDIYIVDSGDSQIKKFDPSGKLLLSWGSAGSGNGQFFHPTGIVVGQKYVYVADSGNARIEVFDKQGNFIYTWGSYGDDRGTFHIPVGLALDSLGNLYVADSDRGTIQTFNTQFNYSGEIKPQLTQGANFTELDDISFDSKGDFYASSSSNNNILKFSNVGQFMNFFGSAGTEDGRFNNPTAIATDSNDNFYVADTNNHRIQKFDPYGNFLLSWGSEGNLTGQFEEPSGIAIDSYGNIYVVDKKNDVVQKFSTYGLGKQFIPNWVKERVQGWSEGALAKKDFALSVRFMITNGLIKSAIPTGTFIQIPAWLKNEAGWWSQGLIDDKTFVDNLQYLVSKGIVRV